MPKIPFNLMPGSWGLKGKTREIAKAEYELIGSELEKKLLSINIDDHNSSEYRRGLLEIKLKYQEITEPEYCRLLADLFEDKTQKELCLLELDKREGKITDTEYSKKLCTLKNEPWVTVINMDFASGKSALEGSFELDWNEQFVEKLKSEGYTGPTPDNIVNQWFMEICRNVALEEFDGTGNFTSDSEANLNAVKRWSSGSETFQDGRKGYR